MLSGEECLIVGDSFKMMGEEDDTEANGNSQPNTAVEMLKI